MGGEAKERMKLATAVAAPITLLAAAALCGELCRLLLAMYGFRVSRPYMAIRAWAELLQLLAAVTKLGFLRRYSRRVLARALGLPLPKSDVKIKGLPTCSVGPTADMLRGSLLTPTDIPPPYPVVIMRTPYGRSNEFGQKLLAERGFAVLVQDTRGRFSSDGEFVPVADEREDGGATVDWVLEQQWCNGRVGVTGISYLGFTAWAAVGTAGSKISAICTMISEARVRPAVQQPGGAFSLELGVLWLHLVIDLLPRLEQNPVTAVLRMIRMLWHRTIPNAMWHLPLSEVDQLVLARPSGFYREAIDSFDDEHSDFWDDKDVLHDFKTHTPPAAMLTGWYDIFLQQCLVDFSNAGPDASIVIGPFAHWGLIAWESLSAELMLETFERHLTDAPMPAPAARVRVAVLNSTEWLSLNEWPPHADNQTWYLTAERGLTEQVARQPWSCSYLYDPADATPAAGGPSFNILNAGAQSQHAIEGRADVLTFTTAPLSEAVLVAGPIWLELLVLAGSESSDFVGRLCCVTPGGVSTNICEGLQRCRGRGEHTVRVDLGSTCCKVAAGHSIRLQVCSGAHPRWARNLQSGQSVGYDTNIVVAQHHVRSGSQLHLPILRATRSDSCELGCL